MYLNGGGGVGEGPSEVAEYACDEGAGGKDENGVFGDGELHVWAWSEVRWTTE